MTNLCVHYWLLISLLLFFRSKFVITVIAIVFRCCGICCAWVWLLVGLSHLENRIMKEKRAKRKRKRKRREPWRLSEGVALFTIWAKSAHFLSVCACVRVSLFVYVYVSMYSCLGYVRKNNGPFQNRKISCMILKWKDIKCKNKDALIVCVCVRWMVNEAPHRLKAQYR